MKYLLDVCEVKDRYMSNQIVVVVNSVVYAPF